MRCGNCGFQNPDSNVRCEKCNAPLAGSMIDDLPDEQKDGDFERNMHQTRREIDSEVEEVVASKNSSSEKCPICGFELSGFERVCPICGTDIKTPAPSNPSREKEPEKEVPPQQKPFHKMTVSPWDMLYKQCRKVDFYLVPIAFEGEKNIPEEASFAGEIVPLSRENTEADNLSISSENQAEIRCIDDRYYILDTSSMGTTFVQAKKPMAIEEDDVILLGNRRFIFKKDKK